MRGLLVIAIAWVMGGFLAQAQHNQLLERDFWASHPDFTKVDNLVKQGHDPKELNSNSFDPLVYAILEKASNETIIKMMDTYTIDANAITHDGRTYVFWAAYKGNVELMEYFVAKGARMDLTDDHGYTVFNFAAATGQKNKLVYEFCMDQGADPENEADHHGANALLLFSPFDSTDLEMTTWLTTKGLDLESTDEDGNNAFNYAAKSGDIELMKAFTQAGVKGTGAAFVNTAKGMRGRAPATLETYTYLESLGLDPSTTDADGTSALHVIASRSKDKEVLNYFLEKDGRLNSADHEGNTPFLLAAANNAPDIVSYLRERGGDLQLANKKEESPLFLAVKKNHPEVVDYLLEQGADIMHADKDGNNIMVYLMESFNDKDVTGFTRKVDLLKEAGLAFHKAQANGNTLYHLAAGKDSIVLLEWVSATGADINLTNREGYSPLHLAAMTAANPEILKYMISQGADKSEKTPFEETVYDLAAENEKLTEARASLEFLK